MRVELPCESGGASVGRADYEQTGLQIRFSCVLPGRRDLCKLWLVRGERCLLLGTPAPEGEDLRLDRTVSRAMLESQGIFPPERVEVVGAQTSMPQPGGWRSVTHTEPQIGEGTLRQALDRGGWRWRIGSGGVELSHDWGEGKPFPAPELFCLARIVREGHKIQVRLFLDGDGRPALPP